MMFKAGLKNKLLFSSVSIAFIVVGMHGFYLNESAASMFRPLRYALMGFAAVFSLILLILEARKLILKRTVLISSFILIFLFFYGIGFSVLNGGITLIELEHIVAFSFSLVLITITSIYLYKFDEGNTKNNSLSFKRHSNFVLFFFVAGVIVIYGMGLLSFTPIPKFEFYMYGEKKYYSQGTSLLFGLGSTYFLYSSIRVSGLLRKTYILFSVGFIVFCASAGGRGEFIVLLVVYALMVNRFYDLKGFFFAIILSSLVITYLTVKGLLDWESLAFISRIAVVITGESFGARDFFWQQSMELLALNPTCSLIGCGFNFFQAFYGYSFGEYPHNIILELSITYGLIFMILVMILVVYGVVKGYFLEIGEHYIFYFYLFLLGISMKSGSLFTIGYPAAISFFILIAIAHKKKNDKKLLFQI